VIEDAIIAEVDGVKIPFASPKSMLRMKQTVRDKDVLDRKYLKQILKMDEEPSGGGLLDAI
jgi:hypothetical protein